MQHRKNPVPRPALTGHNKNNRETKLNLKLLRGAIRWLQGGVLSALLFAQIAHAAPAGCHVSDRRVCEIYTQLQGYFGAHPVTFIENGTSSPSIAAESAWAIGGPDVLYLGNTFALERDDLVFVVSHEFCHLRLQHFRKLFESVAAPEDRLLSDTDIVAKYTVQANEAAEENVALNFSQEYEADDCAARFMNSIGINPIPAMRRALKNNWRTKKHPARMERIAHVRELLSTPPTAIAANPVQSTR